MSEEVFQDRLHGKKQQVGSMLQRRMSLWLRTPSQRISLWLGIATPSRLIHDAGMARNDRNPLDVALSFIVNILENIFSYFLSMSTFLIYRINSEGLLARKLWLRKKQIKIRAK